MARIRLRPRHWGLASSVIASVTGLLVATAVVLLLGWLALGRPAIPTGIANTAQFFEALRIALYIVAGLAAAVGLTVSYRKQRGEEEGAFTNRYSSAAEQLGHEKAAVRLGGVYALARLADDWEGQRQTCIDVLCAYLRMPYDAETAPPGEREVRLTVIRIIREHLVDGAPTSWQGHNLDFTGATFDGGDFSQASYTNCQVSFQRATFSSGTVDFQRATFSGGYVDFAAASFSGAYVHLGYASFSGGGVSFLGATFSGGTVSLQGASFISGGHVNFSAASVSGGHVNFRGAVFSGGEVIFGGATFSGGEVSFGLADFSGGHVSFDGATFSGGDVRFGLAKFSGGHVSFWDVLDWSVPPRQLPAAETTGLRLPNESTST